MEDMESELTILCSQPGIQCWEWVTFGFGVGQGGSLEILKQPMLMLGQWLTLQSFAMCPIAKDTIHMVIVCREYKLVPA